MPGSVKRNCPRRNRPWSGTEVNRSCPSVASYLDFYTNIPDYSELHELSDGEFYEKLQALKAAQKRLASDASDIDNEQPCSEISAFSKVAECNRSSESELRNQRKPPPRIVVQSPFLWDRKSGTSNCQTPVMGHHYHREMCRSMGALSLDSSNLHVHGEPCLQPFSRAENQKKKLEEKHEIPLLSRIPLFHKIMAEQEERRKFIHERNSRELQALVQPFSFTKKEEAAKQFFTAYSNPGKRCHGRPQAQFIARPVPKQLFSDRAYDRMREEQFYRALRKRIRADEMLRNAKMPPSMEAREKISSKGKSKSLDYLTGKKVKRQRSGSRCHSRVQDADISGCSWGSSWRQETPTKRHNGSWLGSSNTDSSIDASPNDSTLEVRPSRQRSRSTCKLNVSRNNLASVLRTQTSRNRMEKVLKDQMEEEAQRERTRFKARLVRLSPAWRTLDYSTDEDLALRLAQRRHEAKRQNQHHRRLMEDIHGRVHHIPPLFQEPGRTNYSHKLNISKTHGSRSKSLESCLNSSRRKDVSTTPRKSHSFHIQRRQNDKSSDSSLIKSDASKDDFCDSDIDSQSQFGANNSQP